MLARRLSRSLKSIRYSSFENTVRDATSASDPKLPNDAQIAALLEEISEGSNKYAAASEIIWKRICDLQRPWHIYKSLYVLAHCLKRGANSFMFQKVAEDRLIELENLTEYTPLDEDFIAGDIREIALVLVRYLRRKADYNIIKKRVVEIALTKDKANNAYISPPVSAGAWPKDKTKSKSKKKRNKGRRHSMPNISHPNGVTAAKSISIPIRRLHSQEDMLSKKQVEKLSNEGQNDPFLNIRSDESDPFDGISDPFLTLRSSDS